MIEVTGNLWEYPANVVVITTNGVITNNGRLVMGRGVAFQARQRFPHIDLELGNLVQQHGNRVHLLGNICSFPTKHHWKDRADLTLIRRSATQLSELARSRPDHIFVLPRPGCGNGGRTWNEVRPLLTQLPDNIHIITP